MVLLAAFFFVFPILFGLRIVLEKHKSNFEKTIGETQLVLLKTYEKGETVLYYIDESARLALKDTIDEIGLINIDLHNQSSIAEILTKFKLNFYEYLQKYPYGGIQLYMENYEFILDRNDKTFELIGKTDEKLIIGIVNNNAIVFKQNNAEEYEKIGYYYMNPSFRINIAIE